MKNLQATKGKKLAMTLNIDVRMVQMFLEIRQNLRIVGKQEVIRFLPVCPFIESAPEHRARAHFFLKARLR
jgi:hypothetical protein